mgnify:CR=1 FL=1
MKTTLSLAAAMAIALGVAGAPAQAEEGLYSGVDLLFLSPKVSNQGVNRIFYYGDTPTVTNEDGTIGSDLEFAQRVYLGYEGADGGGVRVRGFTFVYYVDYVGSVENGTVISLAGSLNLDVDAIDAELTQNGAFRNWLWQGSAGVRWGRVSARENAIIFEDVPDFVCAGSTGVEFEGAGPTFALQGQRPFLYDGLSLFGRGRTALLFGDTDIWSAFNSNGRYTLENDFAQVWEWQLGAELECQFDAFDLVTAIFWEAQRWDSDSDYLGDLGFHGFGVRTGIEY